MVSEGHAEYDEPGKDIVCAAVSVLAQTLVNALFETQKVNPTYRVDDEGFLDCEIPTETEVMQDIEIQTVFRTIKVGMEGISEVYDDYVILLEEEVQ